ncbi:hypothetical protein QNA20_03220, partial [Gordonia amicalis]|nr:hypothetical protein [Gordonia amicalis]
MTSPENPGDKPYDPFVKQPPPAETSQNGGPAHGTDPSAGYAAPPSPGAPEGYQSPQGYDAQQQYGTPPQYGSAQ